MFQPICTAGTRGCANQNHRAQCSACRCLSWCRSAGPPDSASKLQLALGILREPVHVQGAGTRARVGIRSSTGPVRLLVPDRWAASKVLRARLLARPLNATSMLEICSPHRIPIGHVHFAGARRRVTEPTRSYTPPIQVMQPPARARFGMVRKTLEGWWISRPSLHNKPCGPIAQRVSHCFVQRPFVVTHGRQATADSGHEHICNGFQQPCRRRNRQAHWKR
mmetsp:Transcript_93467/g.250374  ORF Transcript_93467/g.250374 Transcript_93467/m.250374 type:complete len:222 (+) Transcript_93467:41-706(+)